MVAPPARGPDSWKIMQGFWLDARIAATMNRLPSCAPTTPGLQLLLVEDNADALESLRMLLEMEGLRVTACLDGHAALEAVRNGCAPDVALIDIGLPDMTGDELARQLAGSGALPTCRFIAMTGLNEIPPANRGIFAHCLVKPVDIATVVELLTQPTRH